MWTSIQTNPLTGESWGCGLQKTNPVSKKQHHKTWKGYTGGLIWSPHYWSEPELKAVEILPPKCTRTRDLCCVDFRQIPWQAGAFQQNRNNWAGGHQHKSEAELKAVEILRLSALGLGCGLQTNPATGWDFWAKQEQPGKACIACRCLPLKA